MECFCPKSYSSDLRTDVNPSIVVEREKYPKISQENFKQVSNHDFHEENVLVVQLMFCSNIAHKIWKKVERTSKVPQCVTFLYMDDDCLTSISEFISDSIAWNISYNHEMPSVHCCCWSIHRENFVNNDVHKVHVLRDLTCFIGLCLVVAVCFVHFSDPLSVHCCYWNACYLKRSFTTMITLEYYESVSVACRRLMGSLLFVLLETGSHVMPKLNSLSVKCFCKLFRLQRSKLTCSAHHLSVHCCCRSTRFCISLTTVSTGGY